MSMRMKAALLIMTIVFAFTAASVILSMSFTRRSMTGAMEHELRLALDIADSLVSTKIELLKSNAANISAHLLRTESTEEMTEVMAAMLAEYPEFLSLTVLDQYGIVADAGCSVCTAAGYENSVYLQKALTGEVDISTTHYDDGRDHFVIHFFIPMDQKLVLSATIPAMTFSELISEFRLWSTGNIFIVDEEATLIANVRTNLVQERFNFINEARVNPDLQDAGMFFQRMMETDEGSGRYTFDGHERLSVYRRVSSANVGWHIGVAAPLHESPLQDVQNGLLFASLVLLSIGAAVSVFVSRAAIKPFQKIQEQNSILAGLNDEIQAQAEQIHDEHKRASLLLNATPLACRLIKRVSDTNYELFDCNEESVKLFKFSDKQEFMDRYFEIYPATQPDGGDSVAEGHKLIEKASIEGRCVSNFMFQTVGGEPVPSEVTLVRLEYGNGYIIAGYTRDLREHIQMMGKIEQKSALLGNMNQAANILLQSEMDKFNDNLHISMGLIGRAVNADRLSIWKNSAEDGKLYCTLLCEWTAHEWLHSDIDASANVSYEDNMPTWLTLLPQGQYINILTSGLSQAEQRYMNQREVKSVFAAPVFVRGMFWGYVSCDNCHDETVFTEEVATTLRSGSLLIANALLHHEMNTNLQVAADELKMALQETQKANNAKSDFLASMSHEMRTPLNAILGLSVLTLENDGINLEAQGNLEKIYSAGETLLSLVNDILDISKIEAGKFELNLNEYATPSLLNDTITNNILRIGEKPIEFILNIPDNLPALLYGDDLRIKQILSNLLSNAFKYTKQGIVELGMDCTREDGTVWLTAWVSDTGIGIKPEDIGNLFSDYTQMDTKLNKLVEGTGLGLPIVKKLTELMDGTISVESEYGKGSKFIVHIKQKHVSDDTIGQETANNLRNFRYTNQRRTKNAKLARVKLPYARVLVVDDNATNLDVARGLMKPYGMQIDTATSGQQAIDAIRGGIQYTAVFMDHMMPGMDGIEAAERIRALGTDYARTVPLIALTANAIAGNEALFLSKGFQDFLSKPIDLARLDAVIRLWVRDKSGENRPLQRNDGETPLANYHIDGIDLAAGLDRFGGDWDAYRRVLRSYAANTRGLLSSLRDVGVQNIGDYAITVHGIKGSSRSIGADSVGALAETLEKAAMDRNIDTVLNKAPEFAKIVAALIDGIDALLTGAAAGTPKPVKEKPDQQVLARIYEACQAYDMETVEAAIKELEQYEYEQDGEIVPWLWENAQQFNVAEITARLQ